MPRLLSGEEEAIVDCKVGVLDGKRGMSSQYFGKQA